MPFKSKAQMRLFYAKAARGEMPKETVKEWQSETKDPKKLPEKLHKKASFVSSFEKTANAGNLPERAHELAGFDQQDYSSGSELKANAEVETGQRKAQNTRTQGVKNENREMDSRYKVKAQTARGGKHYGGTIHDIFQ